MTDPEAVRNAVVLAAAFLAFVLAALVREWQFRRHRDRIQREVDRVNAVAEAIRRGDDTMKAS